MSWVLSKSNRDKKPVHKVVAGRENKLFLVDRYMIGLRSGGFIQRLGNVPFFHWPIVLMRYTLDFS